jgi:hypothetical protein
VYLVAVNPTSNSMKRSNWVIITLLLAGHAAPAQSLNSTGGRQLQLSLQNGISSFLTSAAIDSVYFLKSGFQTGLEGNYYWNNFGLAGRVGYFSNGADKQALEDFARTRKAPAERMLLNGGSQKGVYLFTGPAFQSSFSKWRVQSSIEGGLVRKPASQVSIGDSRSPDIIYYRNVFDESSSFAWAAALSVSYSLTRQVLLGVNAGYLNTRNEVVNYDILRGQGREAKNISSQAGFLNTGIRVSYLFNKNKSREAGSGLATGRRSITDNADNTGNTDSESSNGKGLAKSIKVPGKIEYPNMTERNDNDTCKCEDKVMDVYNMTPYVVEIQFESVAEAKQFLDTYEPLLEKREAGSGLATGKRQHGSLSTVKNNPLYQQTGNSGDNPLFEGKDKRTISNTAGSKGVVQRNTNGQQVFYVLPNEVDLAEVLSFDDGRVTVHVQNVPNNGNMGTREAGSGLATGKRQYKAIVVGDLDGDGANDIVLQSNKMAKDAPARDLTNDANITWGSMVAAGDVDGDGRADYCLQSSGSNKLKLTTGGVMHEDDWQQQQKRDVSTGLSTGKRQHKPIAMADLDNDGLQDMLLLSNGHEIKSPRDVSSGQSSGKRSVSKVDAFTIKQGIVIEADLDGDGEYEPLEGVKSPRDVSTGQSTGKRSAAKEDVYVWKIKFAGDLDGDGAPDAFVCSGSNKDRDIAYLSTKTTFAVLLRESQGIKQTMQTQVLTTSNDNSGGETDMQQKAGISTSRSNIRTHKSITCADGSCVVECEIELNGKVYVARITTRHDTAKNSIGNIR